jgi:predicted dithiol-disulfide oxidoreductase (DUF899 family)
MSHPIATHEDWLKARLELLKEEKDLVRRSDALALRRQQMPWDRVEKDFRFETERGSESLADLFRGRSQLLVYHFMFGPNFTAGCPDCSSIADGFNGIAVHLANHDVMLWAVSRAPLKKLTGYKRRMGWIFPWASSGQADFNFDYQASITEEQQCEGIAPYNYKPGAMMIDLKSPPQVVVDHATGCGTDAASYIRERPGMSAFVLRDGEVFHTYSTYARGLDGLWGMYQWLDRAPLGRNEHGAWRRRHDEYPITDLA